jgi:hypothetical protein
MPIAIIRLRDNDAGIPAGAIVDFVSDSTTLSDHQRTEFAHLKVTDAGQAAMMALAPQDPDAPSQYYGIADLYHIAEAMGQLSWITTWHAQAGPMVTRTVTDEALTGNLYPPLPTFRPTREEHADKFGVGEG